MTTTEAGKASKLSPSARCLDALARVFCALRIYQRPLGLRGMLAYCSYRLFGLPETLTVTPPGISNPVTLRMRTTDASVYEDILLRGHYAMSLPFIPETIVDLGANIGMASIYYANQFPKARIIAVEAEVSNFEILRRNVAHYPTILPIHAAAWNRDGQISLDTPRGADSAIDKMVFAVREDEGTQVRAIKVRTLMNEAHISSIDLLKVDIEGAEKEIFETVPEWIQSVRCLAIELHDRFKPGCRLAVRAVTGDFLESERGETTFYVRKSCLASVGDQLPTVAETSAGNERYATEVKGNA